MPYTLGYSWTLVSITLGASVKNDVFSRFYRSSPGQHTCVSMLLFLGWI